MSSTQQAVAVDEVEARRAPPPRAGPSSTMARSRSVLMPVPAPPAPSSADPLLAQRHAGDVHGREQRAGGDRRRALDVVVEGAEPVAVAVEQPSRVVAREVLPLQQHVRPALGHGGDERLDEIVVLLAAHALVPPADVERVGEAFRVVGADVEEDRQRGRRVEAAAAGVERELADRDAHPAGALVAEPEDALAVA